jgi:trk system potassium uptake protein TrkA
MKIIILGAGQVGRTAAHMLAQEKHNDSDGRRSQRRHLCAICRIGSTSAPSMVTPRIRACSQRAGAEDADMLIALTDSDEST